ncbi:MarR family winged helix-turn-helix transcriptional regulator [Lewinella sp. W8]|uniref:MarR family winged helix-turn-helix transcriptional regulator n=1 Tax=Lewinella sp. W8 TaxID=2528208 RepID=UPI0010678DFD|nr:MarR family transcriptional regulator [Lewinella sp. W8]MTB53673.1 winged helix DNA-binding protein [Lewinella sp. W8]
MSKHSMRFASASQDTDPYTLLRHNLLQSCSWLSNGIRQFLQPFDLTPKQYAILRFLAEQEDRSFSILEVRRSLADKMSDASRLIERLEKKQLLQKTPSQVDRRSNQVRITPKGLQLFERIGKTRNRLDHLISERLTPEEVEQLNELLGRLH